MATTVSENLLSITIYNHGTLSTTHPGTKSTPASYFTYPTDSYNHTMFTEPAKTSTTDSQKISTTPTNSNQHVQSATASSVYRLTTTVLNETSKSTIGIEVTTHYSIYTTPSVSENQLSTTIYNHGTLSTTDPGAKSTPTSYFSYPINPYNHTMFIDPSKTSTTDSQKISTTSTNSIQASQHVQSATASSVYHLTTTVLNETSKSTIGTKVTTHYSIYTTTSVSRDVSVEQQMTTTQYKAITSSRSGDIAFSFNSLPLSTSTTMMFQAPLPITASSATPTISSTISSALSSSMPFPLATPTPILMHPKITSEPTIVATTEYKKITSNKHLLTLVDANTITISFNSPSTAKQHDYSTYIIGSTKTTSNVPQLVSTVPDESSTTIHESEKGTTTESPTSTEQGTVIDRDPSLFTTVAAEKSSQAVTLREAVAWALLSMTLMFLTVLCMHILCRRKRDSKVQTAALYETPDNSCYESSKTSNTLEMNIYESIAD